MRINSGLIFFLCFPMIWKNRHASIVLCYDAATFPMRLR